MEFEDFRSDTKIHAILEHAKTSKSLIRMKLLGTDFEQQIIVDAIRKKDDAYYLLIESPKGFIDLVGGSSRQIQCEFTGADKLTYHFNADIVQIYQNSIWAAFPNLIRRKQLRRNYRVKVPSETQMYFKKNGLLLQNRVINLSLGGSYGALVRVEAWTDKASFLCVGDKVSDIEVIFRVKHFEQRVSIRKAIVVRCEEGNVPGCYSCALNFIDLDKSEEKALTELIYVIQREYLKKRPLSI